MGRTPQALIVSMFAQIDKRGQRVRRAILFIYLQECVATNTIETAVFHV